MVVKTAARAGEPDTVFIPPGTGEIGKLIAQAGSVQLGKARVIAITKNGEKVIEFEPPNRRDLQFQQRVLTRIGIHRMNPRWRIERVVERIAASAGDDHDAIVRPQLQRLPINRRVFPAGVVNQRTRIQRIEHILVEAITQRQRRRRAMETQVGSVHERQIFEWFLQA